VVKLQPVKVATPLVKVAGVLVHENPPEEVTVSAVVESEVSMLLLASSSSTTTEKVEPAVVDVGGAVA
jgi:hypothetical protein